MYIIKESSIHGKGIIADRDILKHKLVGIVIYFKYFFFNFRTPDLGFYLNHSFNNNCRLIYKNNMYYLITTKDIMKDDELTINYDDTPWFIAGSWLL